MSTRPLRVLLVRFSSIGDILLTAPALPDASAADGLELHFLTKSAFAPAVGMLPGIHTIHTIERSVQEVAPTLRALDFDAIVDWHTSLRSRQLIWGLRGGRARVVRLDKYRWQRAWLVHGPSWRGEALWGRDLPHVVERYAQAIAPLVAGGWEPGTWPALQGLPPAAQKPLPTPGAAGSRTFQLACVLGAAHPLKRIPFATWIAVLNSLPSHWHFTLLGGHDDQKVAEELREQLPAGIQARLENLSGQTTLPQAAHLLQAADVVLAGDTGLGHLAAAVGTPVVTVWGCTRPSLGMAPWWPAPGSASLEPTGRGDTPCSRLGNHCRRGGAADPCIDHVTPARILSALLHACPA